MNAQPIAGQRVNHSAKVSEQLVVVNYQIVVVVEANLLSPIHNLRSIFFKSLWGIC